MSGKRSGNLLPHFNCLPPTSGRVSKEAKGGRTPQPSPSPRRRCQRSVRIHAAVWEGAEGPGKMLRYLSAQLKPEDLRMKRLRTFGIRVINELLTDLIYQGFSKTSMKSPLSQRQINCRELKCVFVGLRTNVSQRSLCCCRVF